MKVLDSQQDFTLRLVAEELTRAGAVQYSLSLVTTEDGRFAVDIAVDAKGLNSASVELDYPEHKYSIAEGEYGVWPATAGELSRKLDLDRPGVLRYEAQLSGDPQPGVYGKFRLLRVILDPLQA